MKTTLISTKAHTLLLLCALFVLSSCDAVPEPKPGSGIVSPAAASVTRESPVHPSYRLTSKEFSNLAGSLPAGVKERALLDPAGFLGALGKVLAGPQDLLILVDKRHALHEDYVPDDLVRLKDYGFNVNRDNLEIRSVLLDEFRKMKDAARAAGYTIPIISAYRSYNYQSNLYRNQVSTYGQEVADREVARPGTSQHQLGTAMDLGNLEDDFGSTPLGRWLSANAWKYGFSLSYPEGGLELTGYKYEPWHYRYTGIAAAAMEHDWFGGLQQHFLQFYHETADRFRASRITQ